MDTDEAFYASQVEEYNRICKMYELVQNKHDLDSNICGILDRMLEEPTLLEGTDFVHADVSDMAHILPAVNSILIHSFFSRGTLVFRMLRHTLDLHLINPIIEDAVLAIQVSEADREDPRILEHI